MRWKKYFPGFFSAFGMLILILDGKTALTGAHAGVELCIRTVIPSLFPFFLLSVILTNGVDLPAIKPFSKLCSVPGSAESVLLTGFLGGYPVGAQSVTQIYASGGISKENAQRMLAFCNNAGPAFLFGMVSQQFSDWYTPFLLWEIHIVSAILVAMLLPSVPEGQTYLPSKKRITLSAAMKTAITVMASVCGWVTIFRTVIAFLDRWILWLLPTELRVILVGLLELSNGCCELSAVTDPGLRFVVCSGILAFGGLCVTMQTQSVIDGLSIGSYLKGKTLQTLFSLLLSSAVILRIWFPTAAILLIFALFIRKSQKKKWKSCSRWCIISVLFHGGSCHAVS